MKFEKKEVVVACKTLESIASDETRGDEPGFSPFARSDLAEYAQTVLEMTEESEYESCDELIEELAEGDFDAVYGAARVLSLIAGTDLPKTREPALTIELHQTHLVPGHLEVEGDLCNAGVLVVLGDLRVGGLYWDRDVGNQLVVLGQTSFARGNIYGGIRVRHDLVVTQALWGIDHSDSIFVGGTVRAPLAAHDDKVLRVNAIDFGLYVGDEDYLEANTKRIQHNSPEPDRLRELVLDELVFGPEESGEGYNCALNIDLLFRYLAGGKQIWRDPA
jgi:hypothetical protein